VCKFHVAARWRCTSIVWCHCLECHEASKHHLLKFGFLLLVW
jgi:hypothetical protein